VELEVNQLIKNYLEDAKINGYGRRKMVIKNTFNHQLILKKLPKKRNILKDLPRNTNGIKIIGTWVETKKMIKFKLLFMVKLKHKLQLNKRLNHS